MELVTCKSVTIGSGRHRKAVEKCTTKLTSSPITFKITGAVVTAVLLRGKIQYATGREISSGRVTQLLLTPRHKLVKGNYTLTLTRRHQRHRETITIS